MANTYLGYFLPVGAHNLIYTLIVLYTYTARTLGVCGVTLVELENPRERGCTRDSGISGSVEYPITAFTWYQRD